MEYIIKGKITSEDYRNFYLAALIQKKSNFIIFLICLVVVFSSSIPGIIEDPNLRNTITQILPVLILLLINLFVFTVFRNYLYKSDRTLNDEITLTLSENGINYASYRGSFNYTVEDFRKIIINKKLIAIYVSYRKAILIPRHFFTSKEEELEIESFIKEKYSHNKNQ